MIILKRLEHRKIVEFSLTNDNREVEVEECCDRYYSECLNKEEFEQLIIELMQLHGQMIG